MALLEQAAHPAWNITQSGQTLDLIGQAFCAASNPARPRGPTFLPVGGDGAARALIPDAHDQILERLIQAGLVYRQPLNPLNPEPGERFQEWFLAVLPYVEPLLFGPNVVGSSTTMLALASQFPGLGLSLRACAVLRAPAGAIAERMISLNGCSTASTVMPLICSPPTTTSLTITNMTAEPAPPSRLNYRRTATHRCSLA
ncbi:MAG: hypothetical protein U0401_20265 [Anaerolineae bacterium]